MTYPPFETDTWPAARPLVEWVVRQLPEGGSGYQRPEWSEEDRRRLTEAFFASDFARGCQEDDRELFGSLIWFGCDYGPGDPVRWSPVAVEILLTDWLPRKVVADAEFLGRAPDLLRRFIRFSHAQRGIRPALTDETLRAVDRWKPTAHSPCHQVGFRDDILRECTAGPLRAASMTLSWLEFEYDRSGSYWRP
jgi:hypothetical protein